ncbi:hypothetical protein [Paenibacillus sp. USHLN196]|uniref:hypothetical protein n=1 Tax=Paenibacillus sp. USHLN196 TaxID=3081291 RepID=UPI00301B26B3
MKTASPAEVGKSLKDLATQLRDMKVEFNTEQVPKSQDMFNSLVDSLKEHYAILTHMASNFAYLSSKTKVKLAEKQYSTEKEWIEKGYSIEQSKKLKELEKQLHENLMITFENSQNKVELSNE